MHSSRARSFVSGLLVANSAPHLASAVARRRHLTPLAGPDSSSAVNAVWGGLNMAAGVALLWPSRRAGGTARWNGDLPAFEAGYLAVAAWMTVSERILRTNWR